MFLNYLPSSSVRHITTESVLNYKVSNIQSIYEPIVQMWLITVYNAVSIYNLSLINLLRTYFNDSLWHSKFFIQWNVFDDMVCNLVVILFRP